MFHVRKELRRRSTARQRQRSTDRRGTRDDYYKQPWILREYWGAPVWSMILFALIVAGIAVLAVTRG
jgi:hypothetical protein